MTREVPRKHEALQIVERLARDGFVYYDGACWQPSRRWQAAMMRAAVRLFEQNDPALDLRVPIAAALLETYGAELDNLTLVHWVMVMLPIQMGRDVPGLTALHDARAGH